MGELVGVFRTLCLLFKVPGQAPVAVRAGAEGGLDAPAQGQRGKPRDLGFACGDLKVDVVQA